MTWGCMPVRILNEGHCSRASGAIAPNPPSHGTPELAMEQCAESALNSLKSCLGGLPFEHGSALKSPNRDRFYTEKHPPVQRTEVKEIPTAFGTVRIVTAGLQLV